MASLTLNEADASKQPVPTPAVASINDPVVILGNVIRRVFETKGFEFKHRPVSQKQRPVFQFMFDLQWKRTWTMAAVKILRRQPSDPGRVLKKVVDHLYYSVDAVDADCHRTLLITNIGVTTIPSKEWLPANFLIFNLNDLVSLTRNGGKLRNELITAIRLVGRLSGLSQSDKPVTLTKLKTPTIEGQRNLQNLENLERHLGKCQIVRLDTGLMASTELLYSEICYDSLKYVFRSELSNWKIQRYVGPNKDQFFARATATGDDSFCRTLQDKFSLKHLIFELRFTKDEVGPGTIVARARPENERVTPGAAVIVSPRGIAARTFEDFRGSEKLVLDLDLTKLRELLQWKDDDLQGVSIDSQKSPSKVLERCLKDYLRAVGRETP